MKDLPLIFSIVIFIPLYRPLYAQPSVCGAVPSSEAITKMDSLREGVQLYAKQFLKKSSSMPVSRIPVQGHIIRRSDGSDGSSISIWNDALSNLNEIYQEANMQFFECAPPNIIEDDAFFHFSKSEEDSIHNTYGVDFAINIYIPGGRISGLDNENLCGYAPFPWSGKDIVLVAANCLAEGNTLAHEIGHYFGLYHTHGKVNCGPITDELVDGSNCSISGDDICDTPADPGLSGIDCKESLVNSNCVYTGNLTDAKGQTFNPDVNNIMSYSRRSCRDRLSLQQLSRASYFHKTARSYLSCTPSSYSPPSNLQLHKVSYSSLSVFFSPVFGASAYQTRIRRKGETDWKKGSWLDRTSIVWGNLSPCSTYEIQVRAACNDRITGFSNSLIIQTEGCDDDYCYSYGLSWDYWIERVALANLDNYSDNGYGYTNYSHLNAKIQKGRSYTLLLDPGTDMNDTTIYWRTWIDFNGDGDFKNENELVLSITGNSHEATSAVIDIPADVASGLTRMRVAMSPDSFPAPCDTRNYLDVEDYQIIISDPTYCPAPSILQNTHKDYTFFSISFSSLPKASAYQSRIRRQGDTAWMEGAWFTDTSEILMGLSPCSTYEYQVRANCDGQITEFSSSLTIETKGCDDDYCYSYGLSWNHWIKRVALADLDNFSGNGFGYTNFTNLTAEVIEGQPYILTLTPDGEGTRPIIYWRCWIDFNGDGDFEDKDELVVSTIGKSQAPTSATIDIPAGIAIGATRMRVALSPDGFPSPCKTEGNLDVEDYLLNRLVTSLATTNRVKPEIKVFPNPTDGNVLFLRTEGPKQKATKLLIRDLTGRVLRRIPLQQTDELQSIWVGNLPPGIYSLELLLEVKRLSITWVKV